MAYLLGNISFNNAISAEYAHQIIKSAESMTYRQLCILKLSVVRSNFSLRTSSYREQTSFEKTQYQILYECLDLYNRAFIRFGGGVAFGPTDVIPASMEIQGMGADIFNEMGLATVPDGDLIPIANQLSY